jgi:transposase
MDAATASPVELAAISQLLDLEEFEIVEIKQERATRTRTFTVVPKMAVGLCPHCHAVCDQRHLCRDRIVLDMPMGGWRTELLVRVWQFHCSACDRFFTPCFAALGEGTHATERLLERLEQLIGQSDICAAARFFAIPEKTAEGWYYQHLQRKQLPPAPLQPVRSLGIDELSLKKDTGNTAAC